MKKNNRIIWAVIILISLFVVFLVSKIIDGIYFRGMENLDKANTLFSAGELLVFWGSGLAFIGTMLFAYVTHSINKNATEISDRMLMLEEDRDKPVVDIFILKYEYELVKDEKEMVFLLRDENTAEYQCCEKSLSSV